MTKRRGIDSMIRLHRWRLAETRQTVADLERFAARLRHELSELDKSREGRSTPAIDSPAESTDDDPQIAAAIVRRAKLAQSLAEVEGRMRGALSAVAHAVREFKRYDVVKARRERAMKERDRQPREPVGAAVEAQKPRRRESV